MTTERAGEIERNGAKPKVPPSVENFFLVSEKGTPNIMMEMITTSTNPQEFIPRSYLSKRDSAALQRITVLFSVWKKREVDVGHLVWNKMAYSIAEEGRGRKDAVSMFTGMSQRIVEGFRNMGKGRSDNMMSGGGR